MRQMIQMAFHNTGRSKVKTVFIILLLVMSMMLLTYSAVFYQAISSMTAEKTEDINKKVHITVVPKNNNEIGQTLLGELEKIEGVTNVMGEYNIGGLLEEGQGEPIYQVVINGFDLENNVLEGADDYRGEGKSGFLLPALTYSFNGEKNLEDYVGKTIMFSYDCIEDGKYVTKQISGEVLGTYEATGAFEENSVYVSMDLFEHVLSDYSGVIKGVNRAKVYISDVEKMKEIAGMIEGYGLDVYYETTLKDFRDSLRTLAYVGMGAAGIITLLSLLVSQQAVAGNLRKRTAVIGILKAYGYTNSRVITMVIAETLFYSLTAVLCTYVFIGLSWDIMKNGAQSIMGSIQLSFSGTVLIAPLAVALVITFMVALLQRGRLDKINIIDILRENE